MLFTFGADRWLFSSIGSLFIESFMSLLSVCCFPSVFAHLFLGF